MPTVPQTILDAKYSQFKVNDDVANGALYGARIDQRWPLILYVERVIIEKVYNADPNYAGLQVASDYLYALCAKFNSMGQISPITPTTSFVYLIPITSADFAVGGLPDATHYEDTRLAGKNLEIFWNNINRYLEPPGSATPEWEYDADGVNIIVPGFDAIANTDYELKIYIKNPI